MAAVMEVEGVVEMVDNSRFLHGRIDPGFEESLSLVKAVDLPESENKELLWDGRKEDLSDQPTESPPEPSTRPTKSICHLLTLPAEIIGQIVSFLCPVDLISLQTTCHVLSIYGNEDIYWQHHVQGNIPGVALESPGQSPSFQHLYKSLDPYWFLAKYKIWFCNLHLTGKIVIARFNPGKGCLEGYRLVAERAIATFEAWEADEEVLIHSFEPKCRLHLDQPVLRLDNQEFTDSNSPAARFAMEVPMRIKERNNSGVFSNFVLARSVPVLANMDLWPPPHIPSEERVRNSSQEGFNGSGHKPHKRSEVCITAFRIRRWMQMITHSRTSQLHIGEEVSTYSTLDPKLYTPTAEKPWRGIWVGDYSGHGCEFLLMHQPDNATPFDESTILQQEDETPNEYAVRKSEARIYRGRLEAIKLTGDPNIPRGEWTFVAEDISETGYVRTATEEKFKGARIVRSKGHIANRLYRDDKYIESQLIMISADVLAQYWIEFGHINYYRRVNIDAFLAPESA